MTRSHTFPLALRMVAAMGLLAGVPVRADDAPPRTPVVIVLHPAAEARPALKYQLLPKYLDRLPGNAAVDYGKALATNAPFFANDKWWEENVHSRLGASVDQLRDVPEDLIPKDLWEILRLAARRETCDWQLPIRDTKDVFSLSLPHVQQMRAFARLVSVRARIQIAHGRYDDAVETLQVGYAMAEDIGDEPTLINGLVGMAIANIMSDNVKLFIQQPGAPNLYWALAMLPRPPIDIWRGIETEMNAVALALPELRDVTTRSASAEQWREDLESAWAKTVLWTGTSGPEQRLLLVGLGVQGYSTAKAALIRRGMPAEEVEAMPVAQVLLIHLTTTYENLRDDTMKWFYVPYVASREGAAAAEWKLKNPSPDDVEVIPLARILLPAIGAVQTAIARTEREIALLRTFEAIRMYAAAHEGRLPPTLADLPVPAPADPFTDAPFHYQLQGDEALVEGPAAPNSPIECRFLVRIAQP